MPTSDQYIDLKQLIKIVWRGKWLIIVFTIISTALSVLIALSLPNIYRADTSLLPAQDNQALSSLGQLNGLATLAGINLSGGDTDKATLALNVLTTRAFIINFIEKNDLYVDLFAVEKWDHVNNTLIYDTEIFDPSTQVWTRDVKPPKEPKPSEQEAFEEFLELLTINKSRDNALVTISLEHVSPYIAKQWLDLLVKELNEEVRRMDVLEATKSLKYLNEQLTLTNIEAIRNSLYQMIEDQTKILMLTQVRDDYVFRVIDPPLVPEKKVKPSRALIVLIAMFGAFIISVSLTVFRALYSREVLAN